MAGGGKAAPGAVGLDTSVVLRLLTGEPVGLADAARRYLDDARAAGRTVGVTDTVAGEAYFALQHHYGVPEGEARALLRAFLTSGVVAAEPGGMCDAFPTRAGTGFMDRLIHARHSTLGWSTVAADRKMARALGCEQLKG